MRALVTGGAGFIGSHITRRLLEREDVSEVIAYDNLSVGDKQNVPKDAVFTWGDIRDADKLKEALKGVDLVFHDAAFVSIRGSFNLIEYDLDVNDLGTLKVLEASRDAGVSKVIMASSMAVYAKSVPLPVKETDETTPLSPYGFSKLKGEYYCKLFSEMYGLKTAVLRYFNTYGIGQTLSDYVGVISIFINQVLRNKPITIFGDGTQTRDFVYVGDIAEANILAAFSDAGGTYNIASGEERSINEIAENIMSETGHKLKEYLESPPGEVQRIVADISKAKELLGYDPKTQISEGIRNFVDWYYKTFSLSGLQ